MARPKHKTGDNTGSIEVDSAAVEDHARTRALVVAKRLQKDGRWADVEPIRDQMMKDCRAKGMVTVHTPCKQKNRGQAKRLIFDVFDLFRSQTALALITGFRSVVGHEYGRRPTS